MTRRSSDQAGPADHLTTQRLVLRRWNPRDVNAALAIHSNPDLARFVSSAVLGTPAQAARWLERVDSDDGPGRGWWLIEAEAGAVGTILLKPIPASAGIDRDDVEIGWRADAAHVGHGFISEAAGAILQEARAGGLDRVVAVTDPDNVASQNVARRIGMRPAGATRDYYDEDLELFIG